MEDMKLYVGTKLIRATPMDEATFLHQQTGSNLPDPGEIIRPGYKVIYPDKYISWSPKEVFEEAYREVSRKEFILIEDTVQTEGR